MWQLPNCTSNGPGVLFVVTYAPGFCDTHTEAANAVYQLLHTGNVTFLNKKIDKCSSGELILFIFKFNLAFSCNIFFCLSDTFYHNFKLEPHEVSTQKHNLSGSQFGQQIRKVKFQSLESLVTFKMYNPAYRFDAKTMKRSSDGVDLGGMVLRHPRPSKKLVEKLFFSLEMSCGSWWFNGGLWSECCDDVVILASSVTASSTPFTPTLPLLRGHSS